MDKGDHFFDETMQGLLEAAEIAKGNITLTEWENMPAPTFYVADNVDKIVEIRRKKLYTMKIYDR